MKVVNWVIYQFWDRIYLQQEIDKGNKDNSLQLLDLYIDRRTLYHCGATGSPYLRELKQRGFFEAKKHVGTDDSVHEVTC